VSIHAPESAILITVDVNRRLRSPTEGDRSRIARRPSGT